MEESPDCDWMEEPSLNMGQDVPLFGPGDLRCSDLDVPLFTSEILEPAVSVTLQDFTNEQWMLLNSGLIDSDMIASLSVMCYEIVEAIIAIVLECVEPQVLAMMEDRTTPEDASSSSSTDVAMERNYLRVTEEDIQASFGNSLHLCFGEATGLEQEQCQSSDTLLEIFAEAVTKGVNNSLALITGPGSQEPAAEPQRCVSSESHIEDMVYHVAQILRGCKKRMLQSPEDQGSLESAASGGTGEMTFSEDFPDVGDFTEPEQTSDSTACLDNTDEFWEVEDISDNDDTAEPTSTTSERQTSDSAACLDNTGCCSDELWNVEDISDVDVFAKPVRIISERQRSDLSVCQRSERSASSVEEFPRQEKTFLTVFLSELVEHIAYSTKTSILDVDFDGMVTRLTEKTAGESSSTLPQTVGKVHITIFKQLCREFGSAKLLQAAMASGDGAFEEAVAKNLKAQLQKSTGRTGSLVKKVRRLFCKRSSKVSPACGVTNVDQEDGSTALPSRDQKRPAIVRMFTAMARTLKKPFTSCSNHGSQNH